MKKKFVEPVDAYEKYARKLRAFKRGDDISPDDLLADFAAITADFESFKKRLGRRTFDAFCANKKVEHDDFESLMSNFTASDTDHPFMKYADQYDKLSHVSSLRVSLAQRTRRRIIAGVASCPEFILQSKSRGYWFADVLGVKRPKTSGKLRKIEKLKIEPGMALKPPGASGSMGVYLIYAKDRCLDVWSGKMLDSIEEVRVRMADDVAQRRVASDAWNTEQLLLDARNPEGISHDWKFYCFYGEVHRVGLIQRYPGHVENWFDGDGNHVAGARRRIGQDESVTGSAIPEELYKLARTISLEIPAPFVRIDFLTSDDGYYLGEFTARPGTIHLLDRETDRRLGDAFIKANARLEADFLTGKEFAAYKKYYETRNKGTRSMFRWRISEAKARLTRILRPPVE